MSERLAPSTYMIDSINFPGQYVSVGRDDAIVGRKKLNSIGGIQAWQLRYDSEGLATFQGVSGSREAKGWIAVGVLVYTLDGPTGFELVRGEDADLDVFTVKYTPMRPTRGWQLLSGEDGTPVTIVILLGFTGQWKFIRYDDE
ncbi:hypothetical protein M405DRAFT_827335 [Rhizopogon salebrosus TDB-379]|nr:hypothetical protein M405DRAFT_827335 [Rhizopogon salebrosus TDB-379]